MAHQAETFEFEYFASCLPGIEQLLADELRSLRVHRVRPLGGGVAFFGSALDGERVCLWSRLASRVTAVLARVNASDAELLYAGVRDLAWDSIIAEGASMAVRAHGMNSELRNTKFVALKVKDAICDSLRDSRGSRPDVDAKNPDLIVEVRVNDRRAVVSLDLAGESLYRRSYLDERDGGNAALSCAHAASVLASGKWAELCSDMAGLFDPVCDDGFVVCEAASIAADLAPGLLRDRWGFSGWLAHDEEAWSAMLAEADDRFEAGLARMLGDAVAVSNAAPDTNKVRIVGVSASSPSVARAREHLRRAGLRQLASVEAASLDDAPEVQERLAGVVERAGGTALLIASAIPVDRDASDARAVSELTAFVSACKGASAQSRYALVSASGVSDRFGVESAFRAQLGRGRIEACLESYDRAPLAPVTISIPDSHGGADHKVEVHDAQAEQFASRLRKVAKERRKWARRENVHCYRVYDADLPDYSVAIDVYEGAGGAKGKTYVHVAEYQAPSTVDPALASRRFHDVLAVVPVVLDVRPDHVFSKVRERSKGGGQYRNAGRRSYVTSTEESGFVFEVDLAGYLDTGIFLDHRVTRELVGSMAQDKRFLNLFAYTGTATVHAAGGGARSTLMVDLSQTYLDWAERNMAANGFEGRDHRFVRADVMSWIRDARRAGETYDLIFVDPPTFSNSKSMGKRTWDVQRDHVELLVGVSRLLARLGVKIEDITQKTIPHDFERNPKIHKCYLVRRA